VDNLYERFTPAGTFSYSLGHERHPIASPLSYLVLLTVSLRDTVLSVSPEYQVAYPEAPGIPTFSRYGLHHLILITETWLN